MVRDGRASAHSMISRRVTIAGFDISSYRDCLTKWSLAIEAMFLQCSLVGPGRCLTVRYENLVLRPRPTMVKILQFLDVPWHEGVLHHELAIGQPGGVSLSRSVVSLNRTNTLWKWLLSVSECATLKGPISECAFFLGN